MNEPMLTFGQEICQSIGGGKQKPHFKKQILKKLTLFLLMKKDQDITISDKDKSEQ